ncbi:hypothetical protein IJH24_00625 [Candidatus Saccharibacteria bacterium]|nr:hypothetical protein [Candidatus Saccharibacteria bacterium]
MRIKLKKIPTAIAIVGLLSASLLLPLSHMVSVWADTVTLLFNFNASSPEISLVAFNGANQEDLGLGQVGDTLKVNIAGDERFFRVMLEDGLRQEIAPERIHVTCSSEQSCSIQVSDVDTSIVSNGIHFVTSGDSPFEILYLNDNPYPYGDENLLQNENFELRFREVQEFDGAAYVIWACGENDEEVCLHLFPEIRNENFETEYYPAAEITDITNPSRVFDKFGAFEDEDYIRGMAEKAMLDEWIERNYGEGKTVADVDWSEVDIHYLLRGRDKGTYERIFIEEGICEDTGDEGLLHDCVDHEFDERGWVEGGGVKLQPVGETQGNSSYVSYGDRRFRLTIYNENYKAIELGDLSDLHYVPHFYQDATYVDAIDISGTSEESPAIMHSILLEDTVRIKESAIGGLHIKSIEALAPEGAIDINGENGEYEFVFHSNYYDAVVFKIVDTDEHEYYLMVERSILNNWIREESVQTTFYFDANTSYSDYELIATYVYTDGTIVEKTMTNAQKIDDGLGNIMYAYEAEAGLNLKMATYVIEEERGFSDELDGVYFNARKAGTTDLIYAGTLVGHGLGVYEPMSNYRH